MTDEQTMPEITQEGLDALRDEHRKLDQEIKDLNAVTFMTSEEQLEIARLKKRKLMLKDEIFRMASTLDVEL